MLLMIKTFVSKNLLYIGAGFLIIVFIFAGYKAVMGTLDRMSERDMRTGTLEERIQTNKKVIEDVQKANDNLNTPVDEPRKRRLCEKYDRNRADCE